MSEETVFIAAGTISTSGTSYHTDRECRHLTRVETVHEWDRELVAANRELCAVCDPDRERNTGGHSLEHFRAVVEANPEDIG
jgi:hypothetical protein